MFFTSALQVVYKNTGGRIWNKRWGLPRLTRTRKENRRKDIKLFNQNIDILKAAAHLQPEVPVRLRKPLPPWQVDIMRARLEAAQQQVNLRAAGVAVVEQRPRRQQELAGPPVDPQLQQQLNQREVTRIRQQQMQRFQREQQTQTQTQQQAPGQQQDQQQQKQQASAPVSPSS